ncbi:unnamed protein product [Diabrotica balteata]|uniref:THAP-type domain-containing protein n=1 Tax=Diabrotica balteata TaxID=107213 RepID=A0A9N9X599_DIABA|nr:unnamed protein product [Diabrotica balteata]
MRCAVFGCSSDNQTTKRVDKSVSFYGFPKDSVVEKQWVIACCREGKFNTKTSRICSKHFKPESFERNLQQELLQYESKKGPKLKRDAVPSLYLPRSKSLSINQLKREERFTKRESKKFVEQILTQSSSTAAEPGGDLVYQELKTDITETTKSVGPGSHKRQLKPTAIPSVYRAYPEYYQPKPKKLKKISDVQKEEEENVQPFNTLLKSKSVDTAITTQEVLIGNTINTSVEDQEMERNLNLISKLKQINSNIEIEIEPNVPERRSYKPQPVKAVVLKDLSIPIIKLDALEECCNRLTQENKNLKEKFKTLQKQSAVLPSLIDNTGSNNEEYRKMSKSNLLKVPVASVTMQTAPTALPERCDSLRKKIKVLQQTIRRKNQKITELVKLVSILQKQGTIDASLKDLIQDTSDEDQEIERNLDLISKLSRDNSNIEIEIEPNTPEHRSYKPRPLKALVLNGLNAPIIQSDALEGHCNRLSQENKDLKEKLKTLHKQNAGLLSLMDNTGTNRQRNDIIDLRDIKDLCRTCLLKSKNLTHINDKITLPSAQATCLLKSNNLTHIYDTMTLPSAQATEIVISKVLESILSTPLAVSDNVPTQICETCKNQIIFIATIRYAFEKANSFLQLHSTGHLEKQTINEQNTIERDNTDINNFLECKVEEDLYEETSNDLQGSEEINWEFVDCIKEDLVSDDDPLESDPSIMCVSKVEPPLLQTDISIGEAPNRPNSPRYSKTSRISHTCPICYKDLTLADFLLHIRGHKALKKYLGGPKYICQTKYQASPITDKGLLGGEGEILHICYVCQKKLKATEYFVHLNLPPCSRVFKKQNSYCHI